MTASWPLHIEMSLKKLRSSGAVASRDGDDAVSSEKGQAALSRRRTWPGNHPDRPALYIRLTLSVPLSPWCFHIRSSPDHLIASFSPPLVPPSNIHKSCAIPTRFSPASHAPLSQRRSGAGSSRWVSRADTGWGSPGTARQGPDGASRPPSPSPGCPPASELGAPRGRGRRSWAGLGGPRAGSPAGAAAPLGSFAGCAAKPGRLEGFKAPAAPSAAARHLPE